MEGGLVEAALVKLLIEGIGVLAPEDEVVGLLIAAVSIFL